MPTAAYEVTVYVSAEVADSRQSAIAEASRYLAYADQSDTFGYNGRVFEVNVCHRPNGDYDIGLQFSAPVGLEKDKSRFERELGQLAHVESWKEVPVPSGDSLAGK